jgi:hypothetical protein
MAVRLSALRAGRTSHPKEYSMETFLSEAESTPMAVMRVEALDKLEKNVQ